ncbi:hypothetical protein JCM3770_005304 [Rhodotorula araucariae]
MLKRLSGTFTGGALLLPPSPGARSPGLVPSPRTSPVQSPVPLPHSPGQSPGYPFPLQPPRTQPEQRRGIERATLHKSLAALSALLVALDDLREAKLAHAKAEKRVVKALKELATGFTDKGAGPHGGKSDVVAEALGAAAGMMDAIGETEGKHAKAVQKEYEALNDTVSKFFKRTAKEETAFEDTMASLDAKVAKATASYQSSAMSSSSRSTHAHLDTLTSQHAAYMSVLSSLSFQIRAAKAQYATAIADHREAIAREAGRVVCGLAEREWHARVEGAKRGGGAVLGRVVTAGAWCEAGMESAQAFFATAPAGIPATAATETDGAFLPPETPGNTAHAATLRGPRAPSSSTAQTVSSAHSSPPSLSSAASFASPRGSFSSAGAGAHPALPAARREHDPGRGSTPRPPSASHGPSPPSTYPISPCPSIDGRDTLRTETHRDVSAPASPPVPTHPQQGPEAEGDGSALRRPTPRYGSAPPAGSGGGGDPAADADEFGRMPRRGPGSERAATGPPPRRDSFVARMSAKYAPAPVHVHVDERGQHQPPAPAPVQVAAHARSSSRVSLLAKRYSSPPAPTIAAGGFSTMGGLTPPPSPPPRAQAASAPDSEERPQPQAPQPPPPPAPVPVSAPRRRAYEAASPLPPAPAPPLPAPASAPTLAWLLRDERPAYPDAQTVSARDGLGHGYGYGYGYDPAEGGRGSEDAGWERGTWRGRE